MIFKFIIDKYIFEVNFCLFCYVSDKFSQFNYYNNQYEISNFPVQYIECFESFFTLFEGICFPFNNFELSPSIYLNEIFGLSSLIKNISSNIKTLTNLQKSFSFFNTTSPKFLLEQFNSKLLINIQNIEHIHSYNLNLISDCSLEKIFHLKNE
jgi:hypothetical protein